MHAVDAAAVLYGSVCESLNYGEFGTTHPLRLTSLQSHRSEVLGGMSRITPASRSTATIIQELEEAAVLARSTLGDPTSMGHGSRFMVQGCRWTCCVNAP
ncbi:predicted protein [Histoplasma capsulatum G186AR]|uniref:Uncharacterized protein n=1 Tax=Ajellomyces capsulatus (strain G186AR / H82 / ATCC MYA-2454 / RMSCC 2432) TaxID=447093 RepID=C0NWK6_AJECG|nr:uncharacterized protein HCBG_07536 [Histoplasma capsulatum G186AR]EEH04311.1 predicted protein [Histoplasma capsulatum G186AR]